MQLLSEPQITRELFQGFERRQEVTKCWQKEWGIWALNDVCFVEDWNEQQYQFLVECLKNTVNTKGIVLGAFQGEKLVGFASVESRRFGSREQYVQLSCIHVTNRCRGQGLGKRLFLYASYGAGKLGAERLYISAHPAQETQAFYHALGCVEAEEYDADLAQAYACQHGHVLYDCQLEYELREDYQSNFF